MIRIPVAAASRSYEVLLENGALARAGKILSNVISKRRVFVVSVSPVRRRWGKVLLTSLKDTSAKVDLLDMADGEPAKKLSSVEILAEKALSLGADRSAVFVAFGGGVVGDVVGFLASIYMRGVDVIQIPTTVQAQVDAAIGGKTGVNLEFGKNLIGTFHQPRAVLVDPAALNTLPSREYRAGLYESLKAGIIGDPGLFKMFEDRRRDILDRVPDVLVKVIADSIRLKASIVSADEREGGLRAVLNLGHTIGHALEAETRYSQVLHGEAVAWGMIAATQIALSVGKLDSVTAGRITNAILGMGKLPPVKFKTNNIMKLLQSDKKTRNGVVHFILPREVGKVEIVDDVPAENVRLAVDDLRKMASHA